MINSELDFKLLAVFQALLETKQVSATAKLLETSQPRISRALAKLRAHFDDPLFVRTQYSMKPTPLALELAVTVDEMVELYTKKLSGGLSFDPASSGRIFRITASEVGHVLLFSGLTPKLAKQAPNVQLHGVPLGLTSLSKDLESNSDFAFGPYPKLYTGIHERTIFRERYVCLLSRDHPNVHSMSFKEFSNCNHVIVSTQGYGHIHEQIESQISNACPKANLKLVTHNFLSAALLAQKTDCVVTLPSGAVQALGHSKGLVAIKPPIELPSFDVKLYWHERYHRDPAHQWLRRLIYDLFKETTDITEGKWPKQQNKD